MRWPTIVLFAIILVVTSSSALSTYISMTTTISSQFINNNTILLLIKVDQNGDESAYQVSILPIIPRGFSYSGSIFTDRLDPTKSLSGNFTLKIPENSLPGTYPIVIKTIYHDANMYPFSTVSPYLLSYGRQTASDIYGTISDLEISKNGEGKLHLTVRNIGDTTHRLKIKLYLPNELKCDAEERTVDVGSREEEKLSFDVSSFGALPGSTYLVLASIEYEDSEYHSSFARGLIKVVERKEDKRILWVSGLIFVVLLLVFVYFRGRLNEKK